MDFEHLFQPYFSTSADHHFRVYAKISDGILRIHVGKQMVRMFPIDELPDFIKAQLAMIHATYVELPAPAHRNLWWLAPDSEYIDRNFGWLISKSDNDYVLVFQKEELANLRGDATRG